MIRNRSHKVVSRKNEELVTDPHELLLSLVDMGSLDTDEALLACVSEMSDAECKRVLSSLSLPSCCDDAEDNVMTEPADDVVLDAEDEDDSEDDDYDLDVEDDSDDESDDEDNDEEAELEARIRRLEKDLRAESMNRNRIRKFQRRTNR